MPPFEVAGIGETLWDMFPDGGRLGGAPTNFSCHCHQLGGNAHPISCVGDDGLGRQARVKLAQLGVNTTYVLESPIHPTGRVMVSLDDDGKPTYEILERVAWDHLSFTPELEALARSLDAVCFGTLGQRAAESREAIRAFLTHMPEHALKIFDVNLRAPFYSQTRVEESLQLATVLKLSDEELPVLADYFGLSGSPEAQLSALRSRFNLDLIAYTRGHEGSILLDKNESDAFPGIPATVVDSVGAGDSFTAALCMGLLKRESLAEVNMFANEVAAFVCSQKGACPPLPAHLKSNPLSNCGEHDGFSKVRGCQ